jgi:hypothetical protein
MVKSSMKLLQAKVFSYQIKENMKKIALLLVLLTFGVKVYAQEQALKTNLLYDLTTTVHLGYEVVLDKKITLDIWGNYNPWVLGYKWVGIEGTRDVFAEKREKKLKHWMLQPEVRWWLCEKFNGHFFGFHLHGGQFNVGSMSLPFRIGRYKYNFSQDKEGKMLDQFGQLKPTDVTDGDYLGKYPVKMSTGDAAGATEEKQTSGTQYKPGTAPYRGLVNYAGLSEATNQIIYANADRDGVYTNSFEGWFVGAGVSYGYHWVLSTRFSMEFTLGAGFAYLDYRKTRCTECRQVIAEDNGWYVGPTRAGVSLIWMLK